MGMNIMLEDLCFMMKTNNFMLLNVKNWYILVRSLRTRSSTFRQTQVESRGAS